MKDGKKYILDVNMPGQPGKVPDRADHGLRRSACWHGQRVPVSSPKASFPTGISPGFAAVPQTPESAEVRRPEAGQGN